MSAIVRARLPDAYVQALAAAKGDGSAVLRAYLLLGFAAAGVDLAPFQGEIQRGALRGVPTELLSAVQAALAGCGTDVAQVWHTVERPEPLELDPFANIGIEV